jgi:hypothetical protein
MGGGNKSSKVTEVTFIPDEPDGQNIMTEKAVNFDPVGIFAPYDAVFNDGVTTFEHFKQVLKLLSRTDTLFWCARLNLILADSNLDEKAKQQQFLDFFFTEQQIDNLNKFIRVRGVSGNVAVVHRGTLLELIRWICLLCSDCPDDGKTFERAEVREAFARVLLMANDLWAQRVYGKSVFEGASIGEKRTNALAPFRHSMAETFCHPRQFEALARGAKLFDEVFPGYYTGFHSEFLNLTGLSLDEYFLCLCCLMAQYMNSEAKSGVGCKSDSGIFTLKSIKNPAPHMEELFQNFFALLSITPEELKTAFWPRIQEESTGFGCEYSLKPLRERPILRAADGRMIILDPVFFAEKASVGPLFHLMNVGTPKKTSNVLFAAFGHAFEAYVGNILQHIYPDPGSHLARRLYPDVREAKNDQIQVADFIVDDVTDIVIIEAKAVWIKDEWVSDNDPKVFVKQLLTKYGGEDNNKGYKQLARSIAKISVQEWQPVGVDLTRLRCVYPVLLVHDSLLDAPGFGHFLTKGFRHTLQPDSFDVGGWMVKGCLRVAPLFVMTIDDLECLEFSLDKFTLIDLLKTYSAAMPGRLVSLNNFMAANSEQFPLIHNKSLASGWAQILKECMRRVFPNQTM